jgi:lysophospholipase L1-like esterase
MFRTSRQVDLTRSTVGFLLLFVHVACSSGDNGGAPGAAGAPASLGPGGSGPLGSGGAASGAIGGTGTGGNDIGFGGVSGSWGVPVAGGNGSGGFTTGGSASAGGASPTGGVTLVGGNHSTGGVRTNGGAEPIGGNTANTGGAKVTGGNPATGGVSTGGASATGGAVTGGARATGGSSSTGGVQPAGGVPGIWKVMPLGDSITGTTCYPQLTAQTLKNGGHTNFQFIGTNLNNQSCNGAPSLQTEGHGGYLVTYLTTNSPPASGKGTLTELKAWAAEKPDIVLMHFGTNDCWSNIAPANILSAYVTVMSEFRAQNPAVIFFVSKIIPLAPGGCSSCPANVTNLNAAITNAWASSNTTATSPVYLIDHWTDFNPSTDTADGAHPNLAGAQKMATATYNALAAKNYF